MLRANVARRRGSWSGLTSADTPGGVSLPCRPVPQTARVFGRADWNESIEQISHPTLSSVGQAEMGLRGPGVRAGLPIHGAIDQLVHLLKPPAGPTGALCPSQGPKLGGTVEGEFELLLAHTMSFVVLLPSDYWMGLDKCGPSQTFFWK